ncbi:MAG: hypothetical protein A2Y23_07300 [Clostridiales bacterium GWB2_37_7]|nr:MAG: hypothetical protein A2Y23_07300 [Clostridiales bacterium GWB2_37_7]
MSIKLEGTSGPKVTTPPPNKSVAAQSLEANNKMIKDAPAIAEKLKTDKKLEVGMIVAETASGIPGVAIIIVS